jgi:carboxyl-terminal processing protease
MASCICKLQLLAAGLLAISVSQGFAQSNTFHKEAVLLQKVLEKNHYSPRPSNDTLSKEIYQNYLNILDPYHLYFTAEDLKSFAPYEYSLDNELTGQSWKFFPLVATVYKNRLLEAAKLCESLAEKPFIFSATEKLMLAETKKIYATDQKELAARWTKWLKYQTLWQLVSTFDTDASLPVPDKQLLAREAEIRSKVVKVELRKIKKVLEHPQGYEEYLKGQYFNAITACFDPHTAYLSGTELQNLQSQLATEGLSFGMDLDENEFGDVAIQRLVPGGPAWKSNELHKGDVLTSVKWHNKQAYDLSGADLMEVGNILEASNTEMMELTVRSPGGAVKTVKLKKEKLREDDNLVKSFIMKGDSKIGYISLPGFYTEWDSPAALGCANDVAKEIVKLKKEKIDGLILDLRYNGGGSLYEGLNLAGIFIDEGPLLVIQGTDGKANIIKDANRGTVYDGPLVVMVNGQSASASELLASTLQDYNRAVIVGSATFGKSTSQTILPLDENKVGLSTGNSPYGFVKVTKEKIFRITGSTAQLTGVKPDVYLPDVFEIFDYKESSLPRAMAKDSITKKVVYARLAALPLPSLQQNSSARLQQHEGFKKIAELQKSESARSVRKLTEIPLGIAFFRTLNQEYVLWRSLQAYAENAEVKVFKAENPPFNRHLIEADAYSKEINESVLKSLQADIYIEQSYLVLQDLISKSIR